MKAVNHTRIQASKLIEVVQIGNPHKELSFLNVRDNVGVGKPKRLCLQSPTSRPGFDTRRPLDLTHCLDRVDGGKFDS